MSEEVNNLPALNNTPEELEADAIRQRDEELRKYWLDPTIDYPEPHFLFEYHGVGFSPLGGIQAISGQKKNGKTFVLAQLMAAVLGANTQRVQEYLPGLTTSQSTIEWLGHDPVVLYCDTEMEQLNTAKVFRRVQWLCGWDLKARNDRFFVLWLREVPKKDKSTTNRERWRLIKNAIESVHPDIVFIDGLRDLVNDFNDNAESSTIVNEMMSMASRKNICIWSVLHMNPRPTNDDESKMRGHLGTELGNKVSDTFISVKKKDATTGEVTFTVKQNDARGKDVDDWTFQVVDDAGGLGIPKILGPAYTQQLREEIADADKTFGQYLWSKAGATYTDLERWMRTRGITSNRRIEKLFNIALENGVLTKTAKKKYFYNGTVIQTGNDDNLPFSRAEKDDETPF